MESISSLNDKFSWKRTLSIGLMYKKSIIIHLLIAVLLSTVGCMVSEITAFGESARIKLYFLAGSIVSLFIYFTPLIFARRDDTLMGLLPVKPIEKWVFYVGYTLILTPLIINAVWYSINGVYLLTGSGMTFKETMLNLYNMYPDGAGMNFNLPFYLTLGFIQSFAWTLFILYIVIVSSRHRVLNAILIYFGVCISLGLLLIIGAVAFGFYAGISGMYFDQFQFTQAMIGLTEKIMIGSLAFYIIALIFIGRLLFKHFAKGQIKR